MIKGFVPTEYYNEIEDAVKKGLEVQSLLDFQTFSEEEGCIKIFIFPADTPLPEIMRFLAKEKPGTIDELRNMLVQGLTKFYPEPLVRTITVAAIQALGLEE